MEFQDFTPYRKGGPIFRAFYAQKPLRRGPAKTPDPLGHSGWSKVNVGACWYHGGSPVYPRPLRTFGEGRIRVGATVAANRADPRTHSSWSWRQPRLALDQATARRFVLVLAPTVPSGGQTLGHFRGASAVKSAGARQSACRSLVRAP